MLPQLNSTAAGDDDNDNDDSEAMEDRKSSSKKYGRTEIWGSWWKCKIKELVSKEYQDENEVFHSKLRHYDDTL